MDELMLTESAANVKKAIDRQFPSAKKLDVIRNANQRQKLMGKWS